MAIELLVSVAVRSFALLGITLVVATLLRGRSSALVHRIWTLGLVGCLAVPLVTLLAPGWQVAVFPPTQDSHQESAQVQAHVPVRLSTDRKMNVVDRSAINENRTPISRAVVGTGLPEQKRIGPPLESLHLEKFLESMVSPVDSKRLTNVSSKLDQVTWPSFGLIAISVWGFGIGICLLRLVQQHFSLMRLLRQCGDAEDPEWANIQRDTKQTVLLGRSVVLKKHYQARSPMVAGIFRPVIVLPFDADDWPSSRRRLVLLHELAHVKRWDLLTQTTASFACALNWFNPIAWYGAMRMRKLRETACDDLVVNHCQQPADYADLLLDVAKSYRHQKLSITVAMARDTHVEGRILAILDRARNRASLTGRTARILLAATFVLVGTIGSLQLTSRADDPKESTAPVASKSQVESEVSVVPKTKDAAVVSEKPEEHSDESNDTRIMTVRILDEQGGSLSGARMLVNALPSDRTRKFPNRKYFTTDQNGVAIVRLPTKISTINIWVSKQGYVPQYTNFADGTRDEVLSIPKEFEFRLTAGAKLSGQVVDFNGKPISGVRIKVQVKSPGPVQIIKPKVRVSSWLTSVSPRDRTIDTNDEGKWFIDTAPPKKIGEDYEFRLELQHPDYLSDEKWGGLQDDQGITTAMLRDGTATIVLKRGISVSGRITDSDGNPVTEGLVIWNDRPYWAHGVNEVAIGQDGRYETNRLAPGEYPITILAPGFQPEQRKIKVNHSMSEVNFELQQGMRLEIQIVDQNGKPIPRVYVSFAEWRGTEALYNMKHSNVPDSKIPRRADQNGIYVWEWAPNDGVTYRLGARGHATQEFTLVAGEKIHTIELAPRMEISGRVIDSVSGKPVRKFSVIKVKEFRPLFYSTNRQNLVIGADGQYTINPDSSGQKGNRYRVRIEADGYRSALGKRTLVVGDPPLVEDFQLEPAEPLVGKVIDVSGAPVRGATIGVGTPTMVPSIWNNKLDTTFVAGYETSSNGTFQLAATFEPMRIRIIHDDGFAEVFRKPDEPIGTIQLQPWATISGRLMQGEKPIANQQVFFRGVIKRGLGEARFQGSFSTKTDSDGRFVFKRLPPISGNVLASLGPWQDSPLTSSQSAPVDLKPGEHKEIDLGESGVTITGQILVTGRENETLDKNWSLNYLISRDRGIELPSETPPLSFDPTGPVDPAWFLKTDFSNWMATRENHFVKPTADGKIQINGVRSGTYDLVLRMYEQPAGCLVETIGEKVVTIEVTEADVASGKLDIGVIEVECRSGPRVGSDMRSYKFTDKSGQVRTVDEMTGRWVLLHVWASWCQPCLQAMPELKATIERHSEAPLTVVGLNFDEDASQAKELADKGDWHWTQNYLGSDSEMMRQLAISTVPVYYLIGSDGKLAVSANEWGPIGDRLDTEF